MAMTDYDDGNVLYPTERRTPITTVTAKACATCGLVKLADEYYHADKQCKACMREVVRAAHARGKAIDKARKYAVSVILERHHDEFRSLFDEAKREAGL